MAVIIVLSILLADQLSKFLADKYLILNNTVPLVNGIFHLTLVHNRGAAFGILRNQLPFFIIVSVIAIILIIAGLKNPGKNKFPLYKLSLNLMLAGILGNLIDRLLFGYVIDFFDFKVWPVFNIADSAITIGAILFGYSVLKTDMNR